MSRKLGVLVSLVALALLVVTPYQAGAAGGTSLEDAIEMNGVMQGTLTGPYTEMWFTYWDPGALGSVAFTLNWAPANPDNNNDVIMIVWGSVKTPFGMKPAEIARGTVPGGTGTGVRYWRGGSSASARYWIVIRSGLNERVDFALAETGNTYPPPGLHVNVGGPVASPSASPEVQPTVAPTEAVPPADGTPVATPTPDTRGKTATDALPLGRANGPNGAILPAHSSLWFVDTIPDMNQEVGIDLNYSPATVETDAHVLFKVWAFRNTATGPKFEMIGMGTKPGRGAEHGMKFWRSGAFRGYTVYVEVVNDWDGDLAIGIANIGNVFPPMQLPVGPQATPTPTSTPIPTPAS